MGLLSNFIGKAFSAAASNTAYTRLEEDAGLAAAQEAERTFIGPLRPGEMAKIRQKAFDDAAELQKAVRLGNRTVWQKWRTRLLTALPVAVVPFAVLNAKNEYNAFDNWQQGAYGSGITGVARLLGNEVWSFVGGTPGSGGAASTDFPLNAAELAALDPNSPQDANRFIEAVVATDPQLRPKDGEPAEYTAARIKQALNVRISQINAHGEILAKQATQAINRDFSIRAGLFDIFSKDPVVANKIMYGHYIPTKDDYKRNFDSLHIFDAVQTDEQWAKIIPHEGDSFQQLEDKTGNVRQLIRAPNDAATIIPKLLQTGPTEAEADMLRRLMVRRALELTTDIYNRATMATNIVVGNESRMAKSPLTFYEIDKDSVEYSHMTRGLPLSLGQYAASRNLQTNEPPKSFISSRQRCFW